MSDLICKVPNEDQLQGLTVTADYNGHGTTVTDVLVVAAPFALAAAALVFAMWVYWHHNRKLM